MLSLLGAWRAHGLDAILRAAWEAGVVLCGGSAGSLCWFAAGGHRLPRRAAALDGLGLLPWSNCVHYDAEPERDGAYRRLLADGMAAGYAAEDGAALHFEGERLAAGGQLASGRAGVPDARTGDVGRAAVPLAADYLGAAPAVRAA